MAKQQPATKVKKWSPDDLMKCSHYVKGLVSDLEEGPFFGVSFDEVGERRDDTPFAIESAREVEKKVEVLRAFLIGLMFDDPFLDQMVFDAVTELEMLRGVLQDRLRLVNFLQQSDPVHEAMRQALAMCQRPLLEFAAKCATYAQRPRQNDLAITRSPDDGPIPPDGFRFNGREVSGLADDWLKVLTFVWERHVKPPKLSEVMTHVHATNRDVFDKLLNRIRRKLRAEGWRATLETFNECLMLREPVRPTKSERGRTKKSPARPRRIASKALSPVPGKINKKATKRRETRGGKK